MRLHRADAGDNQVAYVDVRSIMDILPHRYPFLLVDRIIEMKGDMSCIGIKNVTYNEPQFSGHFPGRPIMPGVLIVEALAQVACVPTRSTRPELRCIGN